MEWCGPRGANVFAYAPKDDPKHRAKWREPYDSVEMGRFQELVDKGRETGVAFCYTITPGLDWSDGDEQALIAKLRSFADIGCEAIGVLWDDIRPGGEDLGASHARGTAAVAEALPDIRWWTVTTDYAVRRPTPYLESFCKALPPAIDVAWTGPSVVPLRIEASEATELSDALGRPLLLWENFPVNDGGMRGCLHLGPYPSRAPELVESSSGVLINTMSQPHATRVGVACALRFWTDPSSDREQVWRDVVSEFDGLEPLARSCRSWIDSTGPSDELTAMMEAAPDDKALREYLEAGCRKGLGDEWLSELEPWLDAWDNEAQVMLLCLDILEKGHRSAGRGLTAAEMWVRARTRREQTFGIRAAGYPVTEHDGTRILTTSEAAVHGENLTDLLARRALLT
jgi:hyaluronoglucosaminidase